MSEAEDRLAAMEKTIEDMQKNIDFIRHRDAALVDSINALTIQLSTTTSALRSRRHGHYEPWGEDQQALLTHKYVAKEVLANVLWRAVRTVNNFHTGWRSVHNLLDTMPSYSIARGSRFPPHGRYINLNNLDVYRMIQQLKEHSYEGSAQASRGGSTSVFTQVLSQLQNLALGSGGSGGSGTVGVVHDRASFEEEYKLRWVGLDEDDSDSEVPITGLSTPV